ncbi:TPA: DUF2769 domain-containing protein, partial [Escherichia coli]|nr:DUF2769 domain-containing protein [Escherichia coli]
ASVCRPKATRCLCDGCSIASSSELSKFAFCLA